MKTESVEVGEASSEEAVEFESAGAARELLNGYDPTNGTWAFSRRGDFWEAIGRAATESRRTRRIAIIDGAFDLSVPALAAASGGVRCLATDPGEDTDHGTAVALLALAVAPDARLDLYETSLGGKPDEGLVLRALREASRSEAEVINLSLGRVTAHLSHLPETGAEVQGDHCALCRACLEATGRGITVVAAMGNDRDRLFCPGRNADVLAAGFQLETRTTEVVDGGFMELAEAAGPSFSQAMGLGITIVQPPGCLGSSFAVPLASGWMSLVGDPASVRDLVVAAQLGAVADTLVLELDRSPDPPRQLVDRTAAYYREALAHLPHTHSGVDEGGYCLECGVLAQTLYTNAGRFLLNLGDVDAAERWLRGARWLAPWSPHPAANLGRTLELRAERLLLGGHGEPAYELLQTARGEYDFALEVSPGTIGYEQEVRRIDDLIQSARRLIGSPVERGGWENAGAEAGAPEDRGIGTGGAEPVTGEREGGGAPPGSPPDALAGGRPGHGRPPKTESTRDPGVLGELAWAGSEPPAEEAAAPGSAEDVAVEDAGTSQNVWPRMDAPGVVSLGAVFDVEVGLRPDRDAGVGGTGQLAVPRGEFEIEAELVLAGFTPIGAGLRHRLRATRDDPFPSVKLQLVAFDSPGLPELRDIGVTWWMDGRMAGYSHRSVRVVPAGVDASTMAAPALPDDGDGRFDLARFDPADEADLTIVVSLGARTDGADLVWTARSARVPVQLPSTALVTRLHSNPLEFLEAIARIGRTLDPFEVFTSLKGEGRTIAGLIPPAIQDAIRAVAALPDPAARSVLLVSQDPYIPWELACLEPPLPRSDALDTPFLGAAIAIGRWPLRSSKPPPVPRQSLSVGRLAVVTAAYDGVVGATALEQAEEEGREIVARFAPADAVRPRLRDLMERFEGNPNQADVFHFALHGKFDATARTEGLLLIREDPDDPTRLVAGYLRPAQVRGASFARPSFIFLNACQVGAARALLGDYTGMAPDFLAAGASAVVAPLWEIEDSEARTVALAFYQAALQPEDGEPVSVAEFFRRQRARFTRTAATAGDASNVHLSYQFFGHPSYRIRREARATRPSCQSD